MTSATPPLPPPPPTPTDPPTWDPPSATNRRELRRSGTDKMLGGVCGGLADHTGIDALLWRVGMVALALSGAGIVLYIVLWVLMPPAVSGGRTNAADQLADRLHESLAATGWASGRR